MLFKIITGIAGGEVSTTSQLLVKILYLLLGSGLCGEKILVMNHVNVIKKIVSVNLHIIIVYIKSTYLVKLC